MEENGRKILKSNLLEENIDAQFSIFKSPDLTHFLAAADKNERASSRGMIIACLSWF